VAYPATRKVAIETTVGGHDQLEIVGYVSFSLRGKEYRLDAEKTDDTGGLFIVFRDFTSKTETYQSERFLDTEPPKDGSVELDFNGGLQSSLRLQPVYNLSFALSGKPLAGEATGRREKIPLAVLLNSHAWPRSRTLNAPSVENTPVAHSPRLSALKTAAPCMCVMTLPL
jgi:hypothetical protein